MLCTAMPILPDLQLIGQAAELPNLVRTSYMDAPFPHFRQGFCTDELEFDGGMKEFYRQIERSTRRTSLQSDAGAAAPLVLLLF